MKPKTVIRSFIGLLIVLVSAFLINYFLFKQDSCPTDLNRDGKTDDLDMIIFNDYYGKNCKTFFSKCPADFNQNEKIDAEDLGILVSYLGKECD